MYVHLLDHVNLSSPCFFYLVLRDIEFNAPPTPIFVAHIPYVVYGPLLPQTDDFDSAKSTGKCTFKPALSAYSAQNFQQGQLTVQIQTIIESFQDMDLSRLKDVTNYVIKENEQTSRYVITEDT